jgi:hypothetical protein
MQNNQNSYSPYKEKNWWQKNWVEFITILTGLVSINLIFFAKVYRETTTVNPETAGQLGDFVGGYVGTIFLLVSVVFLYSTLKSQREATAFEKFETKFFEMIKMHRDNVNEMALGSDQGKKIFVRLVREFREILNTVNQVAKKESVDLSSVDKSIISYLTLFYGVGPNSSRILKAALKAYDEKFVTQFESTINTAECKREVKERRAFDYTPFEGHQSRLGHYYRHLYQTVQYVHKQRIDIDKYDFVKTLRAQLTTHEQALLFLNALAPMGQPWMTEKLLLNYRLVRNVPKDFFDNATEINMDSFFPSDYFEWQERTIESTQAKKT